MPKIEVLSIERAQTSMLQWLRRRGHEVDFSPENKSVYEETVAFLRACGERKPGEPRPPRVAAAPVPPGYSTSELLREADGRSCPYCHHTMSRGSRRPPTRDHVRPKRAGGTLAPGNVLIVCGPCNNDKGDMMILEFAAWLEKKGDPRAAIVRKIPHDFGIVERPGGVAWR